MEDKSLRMGCTSLLFLLKCMDLLDSSLTRELHFCIEIKPYPIPKINDLMLKLEGFQYGTSLDLNMGYFHIDINIFSEKNM